MRPGKLPPRKRLPMMRGDVIVVSLPGDYGKPRPALVVQADQFTEHPSVTVLPITSQRVDAPLLRIDVDAECGLLQRFQSSTPMGTGWPRPPDSRRGWLIGVESRNRCTSVQ